MLGLMVIMTSAASMEISFAELLVKLPLRQRRRRVLLNNWLFLFRLMLLLLLLFDQQGRRRRNCCCCCYWPTGKVEIRAEMRRFHLRPHAATREENRDPGVFLVRTNVLSRTRVTILFQQLLIQNETGLASPSNKWVDPNKENFAAAVEFEKCIQSLSHFTPPTTTTTVDKSAIRRI